MFWLNPVVTFNNNININNNIYQYFNKCPQYNVCKCFTNNLQGEKVVDNYINKYSKLLEKGYYITLFDHNEIVNYKTI